MTGRKVPFALILALMCTGALFLIGLALASQSVPGYHGISPLAADRACVIAFAVWAVTAGLLIIAAVMYAIGERRESGSRSVLRLPRTQTLLTWLVLAMAFLVALTLMSTGPTRRQQPAQEAREGSAPIGPEELTQPPLTSFRWFCLTSR